MNRFLGWVAWLGQLRKQAIPPHLLLLVICMSGFTWGLGNYLEASQNGGHPQVLTQLQLLEQGAQQSYVQINGTVLADGQLAGEDHTVYLPLLEEANKVVTYVRLPETGQMPQAGVTYQLSGLVSFVNAELEKKLPKDQPGLRFNRNQYLNYGERPAHPRWAVAAMLISLLCSWPLLVTWFSHYLVFQTVALTDGDKPAKKLGKIWASARFFRGKKEKQRFLEAPASLTQKEGEWVLELEGEWQARFDQAHNVKAGTLFLGSQERPALRFDALEKTRGKHQSFVLTFANEAERLLAYQTISNATTP
ncbi:MAG: hypothetical protein KF760_11135 [Candidatus Eremiobacteraeota bacterium]|nr:hypothetical protein [Candidatus Eremiobacteraeota bacterium]MCW5871664.1 hypothetical protein [Candidatus Eremiobacteraeota bacterium]